MRQLTVVPTIYGYDTFGEFVKDFELTEKDLIFTNEYIYTPVIAPYCLKCQTLFQEKFGGGEPTDLMVNGILEEINKMDYDRLIAVGGGTIIDIAKVLSVNGGDKVYSDVNDMYVKPADLRQKHELFIIPTTCGTGSEVTNLSIINRTKLGVKQGLACDNMYAKYAVLIGEFITTLPYKVFATSSIDALIHAIESYLSPLASSYSEIFSLKAITMILNGYKQVAQDKEIYKDAKLGHEFLIAANYAGIAFNNAGCGTVHAVSYALGGKYHVPHGESNYEFLMAVLEQYDRKQHEGKMAMLEEFLGQVLGCEPGLDGLKALLEQILPFKPTREYGVTEDDLEVFAQATFDNQQRLLGKAYVPTGLDDLREIFKVTF